jgi:REP element-mobilizing transposase RayT
MVIAHHVILSAYGFGLPDDERGSWSEVVRRYELLRFGEATKTDARHSVGGLPIDWALRDAARAALMYQPVSFTGRQAWLIARAFADGVRRSGYVILACAVLPDHVHLVIARHTYPIEQVANRLKGAATRALAEAEAHPLAPHRTRAGKIPSPWAQSLWKVFFNTPGDVERSIRYVDDNPEKSGLPRQRWSFVTPLSDWLATR